MSALLHFLNTKVGKFSQYKVLLASLGEGRHEQDFECGTEFFRNMENPDVISSDVHEEKRRL